MMMKVEALFGRLRLRTWLVLPVLLLCFGCGGPKGEVSGKVTYLGKPLPTGSVTFFGPGDQVVGSAAIFAGGDYRMTKVPVGEVRVTVSAPAAIRDPKAPPLRKGGKKRIEGEGQGKKGDPRTRKDVEEAKKFLIRLDVPAKYGLPDQSGLTYTVQPGSQEYNIDLK
jgi:hypothetical protein